MSNNMVEPHKSSFGLDANVAVLIAYLGGLIISFIPVLNYLAWAVPLVIFFMETRSSFIKFHAMQSFTLNLAGLVLLIVLRFIVGGILTAIFFRSPAAGLGVMGFLTAIVTIVNIVIGIFAIIAVYNGWKYQEYKVPFIGDLAVKISEMFGYKS